MGLRFGGGNPFLDVLISLLKGHKHNVADETQRISHTDLTNKGVLTHGEIDTEITNLTNKTSSNLTLINDTSLSLSNQINTEINNRVDAIDQLSQEINNVVSDTSDLLDEKVDKEAGKSLMSDAEHAKLSTIENNANNYTHPSTHNASIIVEQTNKRFMTDAERSKLAGISTSANNYVHPATHPPSIITQNATNRFMTDAERSKLSGLSNYTHPSTHPASMIVENASKRFVTDTEKANWNNKAESYVAGENVTITGNVISALGDETNIDSAVYAEDQLITGAVLVAGEDGDYYFDETGKGNKLLCYSKQGAFLHDLGYGKQDADNRFANAIIGKASGKALTLSDVQSGTDFSKVKILGETTEIGTGDKSPDNPYTLVGAENPVVEVCGKNILDKTLVTTTNTTNFSVEQLANGFKVTHKTNFTTGVPRWRKTLKPNKTYILSAKALNINSSDVAITISVNGVYNGFINLLTTNIKTFTTDNSGIVSLDFSVGTSGTYAEFSEVMVSETEGEYIPFQGYGEYPITTPPLYSLPNGVADEVDLVSGEGQENTGVITFTGNEVWWGGSEKTDTMMFNHTTFADIKYDASQAANAISTHFNKALIDQEDIESMRLSAAGQNFFIRIKKTTIGIDGTETTETQRTTKLKAWLAAQYANGTPLQLMVVRQTPEPFTIDPINIPLYSPNAIISTDNGTLSVEYNRDINKVLDGLYAAITALGGNI